MTARSLTNLCATVSRLSIALTSRSIAGPSSLASSSHQTLQTLQFRPFSSTPRTSTTLAQVMKGNRVPKTKERKSPLLQGHYQKKGVCSKVYTTKPKKPNSAVRKVCRVKLSTGASTICYIPGEGHNLQEHSVVLIRGGRVRDLPGVRYKVVRGAQDLGGVAGRIRGRSKYGVKKPKAPAS